MSFPDGQDIQSVDIVNMNMPEGLKNITIQAISKLLLASDRIIYNISVVDSKPLKQGNRSSFRRSVSFLLFSSSELS